LKMVLLNFCKLTKKDFKRLDALVGKIDIKDAVQVQEAIDKLKKEFVGTSGMKQSI
jgi:hypothetical protein